MEHEGVSRRPRLVRMEDQDRGSGDRVQSFGKRCRAAKRDPNCPVVIRGWLCKKDSSGLKLWKRRWFVLSNYCLFYYKDSREESVLGSIPLPSYNILFCSPRECKNRKYTFKVVHQGMRSYFFSADTQEDMLGWVRALTQSAAMESDSSLSRRCSSYHDFTQIGGSSESVMELRPSSSMGDGLSQKARHVSRTLSEPSHLTGGRMGTQHAERDRGRRGMRESPSPTTPSPPEFSRRRGYGPTAHDEDSYPYASGHHTPPRQTEFMGTPGGRLGSRPHTPVGRVDIRPQDDPSMMPQTLCYVPGSPKLEFKSTPHTPGTERWQNLSKPTPTYTSILHVPSGRRALGKQCSTGAHTDLLPPLPPSTRASQAPHSPQHHHHHHHHHRSHLSVCVLPPSMPPKPDPRENPPIRPLESEADAVLTRLCGCDKLLQSLSIELAQLQVDKDSVQCALEMTRLQLEEWRCQGLRAQEGALTQKALLQEELVTIRARMCDVSLEMERVWSQYERMESELSVIRSQLQHICNFGMPQEQSHAQRELWMMEDILAGLKVNRDHFRLLLGLQRHLMPPSAFQLTAPHPGSPGSPTNRPHSGLPMEVEYEPPARPPLPQEVQECSQSRDHGHGWTDPTYEGIYGGPVDPLHRRRGNSHPDLLSERTHREIYESQCSSRWTTPDATIQSKKAKMSEEEQIERLKRNQDIRLSNRKKPPIPSHSTQQAPGQSSDPREETPFPLRVTRVVTAVLPSSLVARRVSVEDPPAELATPLPEQVPLDMQQRTADQSKKPLSKTPRQPETMCYQGWFSERSDHVRGPHASRQHQNMTRPPREDRWPEVSEAEPTESPRTRAPEQVEGRPSVLLNPDLDPDQCLTPEQREAKLRRVERIRERVIRSAVRESPIVPGHLPIKRERRELPQGPRTLTNDLPRKTRETSDSGPHDSFGSCCDSDGGPQEYGPAEVRTSSGTSHDEEEGDGQMRKLKSHLGNKAQHKGNSGKKGVARHKIKHPDSPYLASMTVHQRDEGKAFRMRGSYKQEEEHEEGPNDCDESTLSAANLRTKWFLSTNQWHGFIPLQDHSAEPLCDEEISNINSQLLCHDSVADSGDFSSMVSQSLEKMRENHSLFYKIACDINISDSDITKNDVSSNVPMPSKSEGETELSAKQSAPEEDTCSDMTPCDQQIQDSSLPMSSESVNASLEDDGDSLSNSDKHQDSTLTYENRQDTPSAQAMTNTSVKPVKDLCIYEDIPDKECVDDNKRQEKPLVVEEPSNGASDQDVSDQASDKCSMMREKDSARTQSAEKKEDKEKTEVLKRASSLCEGYKETIQEEDTQSNSSYEVIRSASFGKPRVTVLRTSL